MALLTKRIEGTQNSIEAGGTAVLTDTFSVVTATHDNSVDGYPLVDFVLAVTFSTAPSPEKSIDLYIQDIDLDGTNDSPTPSSTYKQRFIGSFKPDASTVTQYLPLKGKPLPPKSAYVIRNNGTGQTISAGWTLKATPYGYGS